MAGGLDRDRTVELAVVAARAAEAKGATDTVVLDVGDVLGVCDLFVVCSGHNPRFVKTLADEVEEQVKRAGGPGPIRVEGLSEARWVLLDWGGFIVHVFGEEARRFYDIERLWSDVDRLPWQDADGASPRGGEASAG